MHNKQTPSCKQMHNHQKEINIFFDHHAPHWDSYTDEDNLKKAQKLLDKVEIKHNNTVLDVGCGTGILLPYLWGRLKHQGILIEVDISQEMVRHGKMKFKDIPCHWLITDAHYLPLKTEIVNVVICFSIFPHLINKEQAIKEHCRILKKGGLWVVCHSRSRKEINEFHQNIGGVVANHFIPEINEIEFLLDRANLSVQYYQDNEDGYLLIAKR